MSVNGEKELEMTEDETWRCCGLECWLVTRLGGRIRVDARPPLPALLLEEFGLESGSDNWVRRAGNGVRGWWRGDRGLF